MGSPVGIVLAAGMGTRVGAAGNKAYLPLAGRPMVAWSLAAVAATPEVTRLLLVIRPNERELACMMVAAELPGVDVEIVDGGATRHDSELNAFEYLAPAIESGEIDVVVVHDGARPLAGPAMMSTAVDVARRFGGAVPALTAPSVVEITPDGSPALPRYPALVRVQTPQAFRAAPLLAAYRAASREGFGGTDTASFVERFTDVEVRTFAGDACNLKVTFADDLAVAERLLTDMR